MTDLQVTRESVESVVQNDGATQVTRQTVETVVQSDGEARVSRMSVEILLVEGPQVGFTGWGTAI